MWFSLRRRFAGAALAASAATMLSGVPASASTGFADAGTRAGLTTGQVSWLQGEVDRYLTRTPGRQTALNEIKTATGADLRIALPGEKQPRKLSATYDPCDGGTAPGWLCLYSGTWGTGSHVGLYSCGEVPLPDWNGYGSWGDDQTTGTWTYYKNIYENIIDKFQAKANNQSYYWKPVWWVDPC
jgi:hypothetical protein